jgi:hypothetical protein
LLFVVFVRPAFGMFDAKRRRRLCSEIRAELFASIKK